MRAFIYLVSGIVFGLGLSLSGMIDSAKVKSFLSFGFSDWNPALLFVLGSAAPVYMLFFFLLKKRKKTFVGSVFANPAPRAADKKLILGSAIFGLGWGIIGICPGPALVHLSFLDINFAIFIAMMFLGFDLQRRFS